MLEVQLIGSLKPRAFLLFITDFGHIITVNTIKLAINCAGRVWSDYFWE